MIKCIIFDCNGTLVDSEYLCNLGLELRLKEYGLNISANTLMLKYRGWKLANIIDDIQGQHRIQLNDGFVSSYRAQVADLFEKRLTPCDGVIDALESIDLPRCVASSGPLEKIERALSVSGLSKYFGDKLFSSYEIGSWKPEPNLFLHAAMTMGFKPSECMVIEDSELGISAAKAADMPAILYDPLEIYSSKKFSPKIKSMSQLRNQIFI